MSILPHLDGRLQLPGRVIDGLFYSPLAGFDNNETTRPEVADRCLQFARKTAEVAGIVELAVQEGNRAPAESISVMPAWHASRFGHSGVAGISLIG